MEKIMTKMGICPKKLLINLMQHCPYYVMVFDIETKSIIYANRHSHGMGDDLVGMRITDMFSVDTYSVGSGMIDVAIVSNTPRIFECRSVEGAYYESKVVPHPPIGVIFFRDITYEKILSLSERTPFTPRERIINNMVENGMTSKEIANKLGISKTTVDTHRARIRKKRLKES